MLRKHDLPNFQKLNWNVDAKKLLDCFKDFKDTYDKISDEYGAEYFSNDYTQMTITEPSQGMKYIKGKQDERCYDKLKDCYKGTYVEEVLNKFRSPYTRVRIVVKKPGTYILPHKDYDSKYSVRFFIPLVTNPWAFTGVQRFDNNVEVLNLHEGNVYFVNVGFSHSAWNFGTTDDIRLIVSVNGQQDLLEFVNGY